jgi:O-antigen/teichoic acid export membrane protein
LDTACCVKLSARLSPTSWLTAKTVFTQLFAVLLFAIQAPVLGPRAFGLISIVMVFVGFCEFVPCEAAADSLISVREVEERHFDTMTTVICAASLLFGVVVFVGAGWFARLFGDRELEPILHWMSVLPVLTAVAAAPTAATKREMQFGPLALRSILSLLVGGSVGLVLTLTGFGVWALVWQALVTRVVAAIVLWYAVPLKFRLGFSRRHFADLARYAAPTLLSRVMSWASSQTPRFMLGLFWGPEQLGLFSLAGRLSDILMEVAVVPRYAVARVELRRFATDQAGLAPALRKVVTMMSVFCFPLCVGGAAVAPTLFHVWLDPRWFGGIVPTQFMLLACMAMITHYCAGATLLALNYQSSEAVASIAQTLTTIGVVIVSAPFGIAVAAGAISARPFAMLPLPITLLKRKCGLSPSVVLGAQGPALLAALVMGACVWLLRSEIEPLFRSLLVLPILVVAGAGIYVLMIALLMPDLAAQFRRRSPAAV